MQPETTREHGRAELLDHVAAGLQGTRPVHVDHATWVEFGTIARRQVVRRDWHDERTREQPQSGPEDLDIPRQRIPDLVDLARGYMTPKDGTQTWLNVGC
jgi:hypothetical protein